MDKHFNISVNGKVQGVFFRVYTQKKAEELGLKGFVKNEKNGSVYIEAEGDEKDLNALATWCKTGSPNAEVENVTITEAPLKNFEGPFLINR